MPIPVEVHVQVDPSKPETVFLSSRAIEAFLYDISEFGIGLLSNVSLPWGMLLALELERDALPLHHRSPVGGRMHIVGRVVHAMPSGNQFRIGISFTRMEEADRSLIRQLLAPAPAPQDRRRAPRISLLETSQRPE